MIPRFFASLIAALLVCFPALAQKPPINSVAGPTTSAQFGSILTNPFGTPASGRVPFVVPAPSAVFVTDSLSAPSMSTTLPAVNGSALLVMATGGIAATSLAARFGVKPWSLKNDFSLVCDGATDDTTAMNTALASGKPLTGDGLTCAVSGNITIPNAGIWLQDVTLKQLSPNSGSRRTLVYSGSADPPISLIRVKVNRNGSPTDTTSPTSAAGIWIAGTVGTPINNVYLEDVEVYGDGPGIGMFIQYTNRAQIIRPYVHDISYASTNDPCTEQITGGWVANFTQVYVEAPRVSKLGGTIANGVPSGACATGSSSAPGAFRYYQTDGFDVSAGDTATIVNPMIEYVGEGIDVSGDNAHNNVSIIGATYNNIDSYGEKWFHDIYWSGSDGSRCENCGLNAVTWGGSLTDATGPQYLRIKNAVAINTGSNGYWSGGDIAGIRASTSNTPISNQCINCMAIDALGNMKYGFYNEPGTAAAMTLIAPYTAGAATSNYFNFPAGSIFYNTNDGSLTLSGALSVSGASSFLDTMTVGMSTNSRQLTNLVSAGDYQSTTLRVDDNGLKQVLNLTNLGINGANQGMQISFPFGTGHASGGLAASIAVISTDTWAGAGSRSAQVLFKCSTAGSLGTCLTIDTALTAIPTDLTAAGTVRANTGFSANGTAGISKTFSVRKGDDSGACNVTATLGLITAQDCTP